MCGFGSRRFGERWPRGSKSLCWGRWEKFFSFCGRGSRRGRWRFGKASECVCNGGGLVLQCADRAADRALYGAVHLFQEHLPGADDLLSGVFTGDWKKAWEGIKKLAMAPIEAIKSFFEKIFGSDLGESIKGGLNALIDLVNRFIGWLNDKLHFSWDGLTIGGKRDFCGRQHPPANIPSIPKLAQGAVLGEQAVFGNGGRAAARHERGSAAGDHQSRRWPRCWGSWAARRSSGRSSRLRSAWTARYCSGR